MFYYFSDHLKTASVETDSLGNIKDESDFYPWGGELQFTNTNDNHYKFTDKERDAETGLGYFGARYTSSSLGRFLSADPVGESSREPQSLNRYSYIQNSPLNGTDPTGMTVVWNDSKKTQKQNEASARTNAQRGFEKRLEAMKNSKDPKIREKVQNLQKLISDFKIQKQPLR